MKIETSHKEDTVDMTVSLSLECSAVVVNEVIPSFTTERISKENVDNRNE